MQKEAGHSYIPTLNGWRAFSILYVLAFHGSWLLFQPDTGLYPNEKIWHIVQNGVLGVYFFFGISGFLITTRLLEEWRTEGRISLKFFYWRRFFRIIPIVAAFLLVLLLLKILNLIRIDLNAIFASLFFLRNYLFFSDWYSGHFWSLSMEEHYYLIWPGLFCLFMKMKRPWIPILSVLLLVVLWRSIEFRYAVLAPHLQNIPYKFRSDLYFDYLMWGSMVAYLYTRQKFRDIFSKLTRSWMIFPMILLLHFVWLTNLPFHDMLGGIIIQLCILLTVHFPLAPFSRFLESKWFARIGVYSYSLYVWQQLFLVPNQERIKGAEILQSLPINFLLLILTAYLSFNFLENPAIAKGRTLWSAIRAKTSSLNRRKIQIS
jgi:peptidoglycan/LPS O-acetylase OafA/YrhL